MARFITIAGDNYKIFRAYQNAAGALTRQRVGLRVPDLLHIIRTRRSITDLCC
jgi:hypothetical protein